MQVVVNLSNHHIHLSQKDVESLFGPGYSLKLFKDLFQPGFFAAQESVSLVTPKGGVIKLRVMGPVRRRTQCELLQSDIRCFGFSDIPVSGSGQSNNSVAYKLIGPKGEIMIKKGLIIAQRHIHLDPKTAQNNNLSNKQKVSITAGKDGRKVTFHNVIIRVKDRYLPECHLDFDEGNAAGIANGDLAKIINT